MFELFRGFWTGNIIQDVPVELAQCEFGCKVTECRHGDWLICKNMIVELEGREDFAKAASHLESAATGQSPTRPQWD